MAGTLKWYGNGLLKVCQGAINLETDTIKAMVTTVAYVPDQDAHVFRSSVTNEIAASGDYVAGGVATDVACTYDAATNQVRITVPDVVLNNTSITNGRVVVLYKSRGGVASADELIAFGIHDTDQTSSNGTFTLDFGAPSLTLTVAA